jgi:hypothetical protein
MTPLAWLRRLLDDTGNPEIETQQALEGQTEVFVAAAPMMTPPTVFVNGTERTSGWMVPETVDRVVFSIPLSAGDVVVVRYQRRTFPDSELESYLEEAKSEYSDTKHLVYRAAIWAIDSLALGPALAFDFGAGQENFQFSSIFAHLLQLRETWEKWLEQNAELGELDVVDMHFDELEPGDIEYDPGSTEFGVGGYYPDSPNSRGGLT